MIKLLFQAIQRIVKDYSKESHYLALKVSFLLFVAFLFVCAPIEVSQAATGLRIYNYTTKKESTYTGKQVIVTLNGSKISKATTPGIIIDGIALVPYTDIFKNSSLLAECSYNKSKGTLSISKDGITIIMNIGSKKATLNGKAVTLPVAPVIIKYVKANTSRILVPSRYVAEALKMDYTWNAANSTVAMKKNTLLLSYNGGAEFEYTGAKGNVTIDGTKVSLGYMPVIIKNNTAMVRAEKVFADSKIGADYTYDSTTKTVTLTKDDIVLEMTIGSKTAYLNGKTISIDEGPMMVTNIDLGYSYLLVPGNFTAKSLGYNYVWVNSSLTSKITTKSTSSSSEGSTTAPELGDDGIVNEVGTILQQWNAGNSLFGSSSGQTVVKNTGELQTQGNFLSLTRDYTNTKMNAETYALSSSTPFSEVTASSSGQKLSLQASNMVCANQSYPLYGSISNYINSANTIFNSGDLSTTIDFDVNTLNFTYDIAMSEDRLTVYVTVYVNALTNAVIGTNNAGDYITLTGISKLNVTVSQQPNVFYIDLPYTTNLVGDLLSTITGSKYVTMIYSTKYADKTQITVILNDGYEYYVSEKDNQYSILFQTPGGSTTPSTGSGSTPVVTVPSDNPSEYEIIIPNPAALTISSIDDEDDYFNHRFIIKLQGDYTSFYTNNSIYSNSGMIEDVSVSLNSNNETEIAFQTSDLQGYQYVVDNENIYLNIGSPSEIYRNIVLLDPGHGGAAVGALYSGYREKDLNLEILYEVGDKYFNSDNSSLKVYYTRKADNDMGLSERAAFAAEVEADLFVSLHLNASAVATAGGTEVYYSPKNNSANDAGLTSQKLANLLGYNITDALGTNNRGVKSDIYTVIHKNTVPAVLIELGFMSNKSDLAVITDSSQQEVAAKTIYESLLEVFAEYPTGR